MRLALIATGVAALFAAVGAALATSNFPLNYGHEANLWMLRICTPPALLGLPLGLLTTMAAGVQAARLRRAEQPMGRTVAIAVAALLVGLACAVAGVGLGVLWFMI